MTITQLRSPALVRPFRFFDVSVRSVRSLSPSFVRVTFVGEDLDRFGDGGPDQRIKVVVPLPGTGLETLPRDPDTWYASWQRLPDEERNPLRTYTLRGVRPELKELDVDVVRHGGGAAADWLCGALPGARTVLLGPDRGYPGDPGGAEWRPPAGPRRLLLVGDETAVPAIARILEGLPEGSRGDVVLEVPEVADFLPLHRPPGVRVSWLARGAAPVCEQLVSASTVVASRLCAPAPEAGVGRWAAEAAEAGDTERTDPDDVVWEVPTEVGAEAAQWPYAWIAGEAGAVTRLRRRLVGELGWPRQCAAFMGYWRLPAGHGS